jgi:hypothetical protein
MGFFKKKRIIEKLPNWEILINIKDDKVIDNRIKTNNLNFKKFILHNLYLIF